MGNQILFSRKDFNILGYVVIVRKNSVVVRINNDVALKLKYENNLTIVNHKNYEIIVEKGTVA
ncbi:DUF2187 family protein [Bacillus weihaiensis]|uniref:DUF2187 family protein n=1 Tax=Bacillus weihaiensis TaxID=1547283 RepID=UPI0023573D83|nr:DUF2187 family protein [Bacillus weihaiensis]